MKLQIFYHPPKAISIDLPNYRVIKGEQNYLKDYLREFIHDFVVSNNFVYGNEFQLNISIEDKSILIKINLKEKEIRKILLNVKSSRANLEEILERFYENKIYKFS